MSRGACGNLSMPNAIHFLSQVFFVARNLVVYKKGSTQILMVVVVVVEVAGTMLLAWVTIILVIIFKYTDSLVQ